MKTTELIKRLKAAGCWFLEEGTNHSWWWSPISITGINRKQLSHYVTGHSRPSPATVQKIQAGIDRFSRQLSQVCLI